MLAPFAHPDRTLLAFHAEKLHDDEVWRRTLSVAQALADDGVRLTFFVYTYRADFVGADVTKRVRELDTLGHEIAQHTHFYTDTPVTGEKSDDLSNANVAACIRRDFERLLTMAPAPRGFTSGAFLFPDGMLDVLSDLGFRYDSSTCHPRGRASSSNPQRRWLAAPKLSADGAKRLVCLPTSCSLGQWFKWGRRTLVAGSPSYQMVYLHDYDLVVPKTRLLLGLFLRLRQSRMDIGAKELSDSFATVPGS